MMNRVYLAARSSREAVEKLIEMLGEDADLSKVNAFYIYHGVEHPVIFDEVVTGNAESINIDVTDVSSATTAAAEVVIHQVTGTVTPKGIGVVATITPKSAGVRAVITPKSAGIRATITPKSVGVTATITPKVTSGVRAVVTPRTAGVHATITPRVSGVRATVTPRQGTPTVTCFVENRDGSREEIGVNDPIPYHGQSVSEAREALRERAEEIAPTVRATITPRTSGIRATVTPRIRATVTPKH